MNDVGQQFVTNKIDVGVGLVLVFRWHRVSSQQSRAHTYVAGLAELSGNREHLELAVDIEAVARFDFDRADALGGQRPHSWQGRSV